MERCTIVTSSRNEFVDITAKVQKVVADAGVREGICLLYVPHTTAGITVNEGADPSVRADILAHMAKQVPHHAGYRHLEGNADAHIKSMLVGVSEVLPVQGGRLHLGRWQSIFFCEFDGPRTRQVFVQLIGGGTP